MRVTLSTCFVYRVVKMYILLRTLVSKSWSANSAALLVCLFNINTTLAQESIEHFRAIPIASLQETNATFMRHSVQDKHGYIWLSGSAGLSRFDGYTLTPKNIHQTTVSTDNSPFLFKDSDNDLYIGDRGLHIYNAEQDKIEPLNVLVDQEIQSIDEDKNKHLWLAGKGFGLVQYNKTTQRILNTYDTISHANLSNQIDSLLVDRQANVVWFTDNRGVFTFNIATTELRRVTTPLDDYFSTFTIRDISLNQSKRELLIGTQFGLLIINVDSEQVRVISTDNDALQMPIDFVTTTFIDKNGDIWLGFEKAGVCRLDKDTEAMACMSPSSSQSDKLPFAPVEDISQDDNGNLWFSMNNFGVARVTPHLEKFRSLKAQFTNSVTDYFSNSFDGVVTDSKDVWIATDGGGVNIFNYQSKLFSNMKNIPNDPNSPSSNSVISLTEDEYGAIWAGTWAGGMFKVDPDTKQVTQYMNQPNADKTETVASNFVFVVESDHNDGIWMSIWQQGLQYYNQKTGKFIDYLQKGRGGNADIANHVIYHLQYFDEKLFIAGEAGLEYFDVSTQTFIHFESLREYSLNYVLVESLEEIWLGSDEGLIRYDMLKDEFKLLTKQDGLSDSVVHYLAKDDYGKIWVATATGLTVYDPTYNTFKRYFERDGLVGRGTSPHGEFIKVDGQFYIPSRDGVSIIDPSELPFNDYKPKTVLNQIEFIRNEGTDAQSASLYHLETDSINYKNNSLRFSFSSLSYVHPEYNQFKYRLVGWQTDYVYTPATERTATYTNLPAGDYVFEVYSSNSSGVWDDTGTRVDFTILPPWWATWWAIFLFVVLTILSFVGLINLRLSLNLKREKELKNKVAEKTKQLKQQTLDLKHAGESLAALNSELEQRVEQRTEALQLEVNERKSAEYKLFYMAFHDSLTELPNRERIVQLIEQFIDKCKSQPNYQYGVMFLDGDRFKQVNDTYGHTFGDKLLIASAKRLKETVGSNDTVGRLGGDEFTVVTEGKNEKQLLALAHHIVEAFNKPFMIEGQHVVFNVSIGVVSCGDQYRVVPEVLRNADIAMYRAKESGKGTYKLFDTHMQKETVEALELELGLRDALNKNALSVVYQPIINLHTGQIDGFEALIRWKHPEKGFISPMIFIPIAEETGLIWDIGKWVLEEACKMTKHWHDMNYLIKPNISVNLSTHQLRNESFLSCIDDILSSIGLDSRYLKLEITESVIIENNKLLEQLYASILDRKIDLAIDDFGTGYSSLAYLSEIPVQFLKIDRRFVAAIDDNKDGIMNDDALSMLNGIVSLAKGVGKKITAEGIETRTQLQQLIRSGCDFAQGYYFSKPVSYEDATQLLKHSKTIEQGGVGIDKQLFDADYKVYEDR